MSISDAVTMSPININDAKIVSSDVTYPEADESLWLVGSTYALGDTVSYAVTHSFGTFWHKFESLQAGNIGNIPEARPNENSFWTDLGAVNKEAMFFNLDTFQTTSASPFVVEINPGERFGAIGLNNLLADSVTVQTFVGAVETYSNTIDLIDRSVASWYDYFYQPFRQVEKTALFNLTMNAAATVKLTFTRADGDVGVGNVLVGVPFAIGTTLTGSRSKDINYSSISVDDFGLTSFTPRRSSLDNNTQIHIKKSNVNAIRSMLKDVNATVTLWAGLTDNTHGYFGTLLLVGFYDDFEFSLDHQSDAFLNLSLRGI